MARAKLVLVLDCLDPDALSVFWCEALGYDLVKRVEQYVVLRGDRDDAILLLQKVPESKTVKNRMHIDVHVPDIDAKAKELEAAGATRLYEKTIEEIRWITMADPEGNEFCVCNA